MKAKLNQENYQWLSGEIVEKKPLRLGFEYLKRAIDIGYQLMKAKLNQEI